jgi:hypothetical protein
MNTCPVCGYSELQKPAYDRFGYPSFEICPCCGVEFGYQDARRSHESLRAEWVAKGTQWRFPEARPPGWDPLLQLQSAANDPGRPTAPGSSRDDPDGQQM